MILGKIGRVLDTMLTAIIILGAGYIFLSSAETHMIYKRDNLPVFHQHQDLTKNTYSPLVRLEKKRKSKKDDFFCSAVIISDDYAVTAAHCLMNDSTFSPGLISEPFNVRSIANEDGSESVVAAKAAALNNRADYGLITGDFKKFTKLLLMNSPMSIAQLSPALYTCGFPWGASDVCYLTQPVGTYFGLLEMRGILFPGMSGGPVLDATADGVFAVNSAVGDGYIIVAPLVGLFETLGVEVVP